MKTIKIIDLFDMYARGGQQVKSIIYKDKNYVYDGNSVLSQLMFDYKDNILYLLNDNVKLIENPNDILSDLLLENKKYKKVIANAIDLINNDYNYDSNAFEDRIFQEDLLKILERTDK